MDGIKRAEEIRKRLAQELGRTPRRKDFIKAGQYKVWMALYRYRKKPEFTPTAKNVEGLEDYYMKYIRGTIVFFKKSKRKWALRKLLIRIFEDFVFNLGYENTKDILAEIRKKRE